MNGKDFSRHFYISCPAFLDFSGPAFPEKQDQKKNTTYVVEKISLLYSPERYFEEPQVLFYLQPFLSLNSVFPVFSVFYLTTAKIGSIHKFERNQPSEERANSVTKVSTILEILKIWSMIFRNKNTENCILKHKFSILKFIWPFSTIFSSFLLKNSTISNNALVTLRAKSSTTTQEPKRARERVCWRVESDRTPWMHVWEGSGYVLVLYGAVNTWQKEHF